MPQHEDITSPTDYAELFRRYGPVILAYLHAHAPLREEAEDLTLDVFTDALANQQIITWDGPRQLSWLKRVASNKLADSYRRSNRRPIVALDQIAETLFDGPDPELMALRSEDHAQLYQRLRQLSPIQQQILRLRYGHELHTAEIAELLNKSDTAIRQMLSRTLSQLRTLYDVRVTRKESKHEFQSSS